MEGHTVTIDWRSAGGAPERLDALATELVRAGVDVIVTYGTPPTLAAKRATQTIPIVFLSVTRPVERGVVASLARPGGNVTGVAHNPQALGRGSSSSRRRRRASPGWRSSRTPSSIFPPRAAKRGARPCAPTPGSLGSTCSGSRRAA